MKKIFALLTVLLLLPVLNSNARSWYGGPFNNESRNATGDDGVYEAVATMSNGVGLYRWAVRNNPNIAAAATGGTTTSNVEFGAIAGIGQTSANVWYYKGITYYGQCFGIVNTGLGVVSCVGNASTNVDTLTTSVDVLLLNPAPAGNVGFCNSNFMAKITDEFPQMRFSGKGTASFVGEIDVDTRTDTITVTGENDIQTTTTTNETPEPGTTVTTVTVVENDASSTTTTTTTSSGGEDPDFSQRGHVRKFVVIGSQVAYEVAP